MKTPDQPLSERLLELDSVTPALRQRYDMEVQSMLEQKLTGVRRLAWIGSGILGVGFVVLFGIAAVVAPAEFPLLGRAAFICGALFGLIWAGFCVWLIRRGSVDRRTHGNAAAGAAWGFTIMMVVISMLLADRAPDQVVGVRMVVTAIVFLIMAAVFLILARIQTAELNTREKVLEIECQLAELLEAVRSNEEASDQDEA